MSNNYLKGTKVILVTHYVVYSASQALRDYLRDNGCQKLLYISHPLIVSNPNRKEKSYFEESRSSKTINTSFAKKRFNSLILSSIYEMCLTLKWIISAKEKFSLYIGVDNLNVLWGLVLKLFGKVDKVVYYTIDYFPTRFGNKLLNKLYHLIDKLCVRFCDETWNVSPVMAKARQKYNNMNPEEYRRQYTVPIGIWYDETRRKKFADIDKTKLIFAGHLVPHMGVDLAIKALPQVISKIPDIKLEIIGGGEDEQKLKKLTKELKLNKYIKFWGWIRDRQKLEKIMSGGAVGIAPFNTQILDDKVKNADPGKIKDYMQLGMPVIVSDAISTANDIKKNKCGIIIRYNTMSFTNAVVELLLDKDKLRIYRQNALKYVKQFDYNLIFRKNLERILSS